MVICYNYQLLVIISVIELNQTEPEHKLKSVSKPVGYLSKPESNSDGYFGLDAVLGFGFGRRRPSHYNTV